MYCVFDKFVEVGMIIYINVFIMLIFYESFKIKVVQIKVLVFCLMIRVKNQYVYVYVFNIF